MPDINNLTGIKKLARGVYVIPSSDNTDRYKVDIIKRTCTCLHYEFSKTECKHMNTMGMFVYMEFVPVIQDMTNEELIRNVQRKDVCKEIIDGIAYELGRREIAKLSNGA